MVNLNIAPDEGWRLAHLYVNGEDVAEDVVGSVYSFTSQGDVTVRPEFVRNA